MRLLKLFLTSILTLVFSTRLLASTLTINSQTKIKQLKILEHNGKGATEVEIGKNDIQLEYYPNAVYLINQKSEVLTMIWVPSNTSSIELSIDENFKIIFLDETPEQIELTKIFRSSNHWSLFPYEPVEDKPLEPILALEAKAIVQNLRAVTDRSVLENLYEISQQREIDNWSTEVLSVFLREPTNNLYDNGKLVKVHGLDSLENQVEITPNGEKYLLLAISGSWCGPCIKGIPKLKSTYDEVSDKVMLISLWNDPNLRTFRYNHIDIKQLISWTSLWDRYGLMANSLKIKVYPTYILFDPTGTEINRWEGKLPSNLEL